MLKIMTQSKDPEQLLNGSCGKKIVLTNTVSKAMNELSTLQSELLQMCCFWVCSHACKWLYEAVLTCRTHRLPLPVHDGYLAHLLRLAHVWCPHRQALLPWHCSDYATHSQSRSSYTAFVIARLITSHLDTQGLGYVCKALVFDALAIRPRPLTVRWCWETHASYGMLKKHLLVSFTTLWDTWLYEGHGLGNTS